MILLLGDMRSYNYVVIPTHDFDHIKYKIRAIDFDQQSYEGRRAIYLPQYFKQNNPIIKIGLKHMTQETVQQYQREERALIATRVKAEKIRIDDLLSSMVKERLSKPEHVDTLRKELAEFYEEPDFLECNNMGELVKLSLEMLIRQPDLYKDY